LSIKKLTANRGADAAFDAVGINASLKTAIDSLRKGGSRSGYYHRIHPSAIHKKNMRGKGYE